MTLTRRNFIKATAAGLFASPLLNQAIAAKQSSAGIKVGVCDWSLGGKTPGALDTAKKIGLDGVEISPKSAEETLSYVKPENQIAYKEKMAATGIAIPSVAMTIANANPLATDPRAPAWLEQTIAAASGLGAGVILMGFFGKSDLRDKNGVHGMKNKEFAAIVERLKVAAPIAEEKGVILGIESTLSAKQHIAIMDAVGHKSIQIYYDIANSTRNGYDVPAEIKMLGNRICQFHFKDNKGEFNSGDPEMGPIINAIKKIKYKGWLILERGFGEDRETYFSNNAKFIRNAFK